MKTAKDLAYKAYRDGQLQGKKDIKENFENWWSEWYGRQDHKDSFYHEHNVYLDGKRYIKAE